MIFTHNNHDFQLELQTKKQTSKLLHSEFSEKKLNFEGPQTYERHENHLIMS